MIHEHSQTAYIIFNAIDPYGLEVNQFLAGPEGTQCNVRFKSKWMPTIRDPDELIEKQGVLIMRDWDSAQLIPLRRLRIHSILPVGEILDIEWIAQEMIDYDSDPVMREQQIEKFNRHVQTLHSDYDNVPQQDFDNLVFFVNADFSVEIQDSHMPPADTNHELHKWGKVIDAVGRLSYYVDVDFLKVVGILDSSKRVVGVTGHDFKRYTLGTDQSYLLTVYQRAYTDRPRGDASVSPRTLRLGADLEAVRLVEKTSAISGKYAGHRFVFKTETLRRRIYTSLRLEIQREDDRRVPPVYLPIRIETPVWRYMIRLASIPLFILGVVGLFLSDQWFPSNPSLALAVSILVMIMTGEEARDLIYSAIARLGVIASSR